MNRLEQRLHEAQQASNAGDVPGTQAALAAYSTIVVEAAKGSDGDPTARAALAGDRHPPCGRPDPDGRQRPIAGPSRRRARPVRRARWRSTTSTARASTAATVSTPPARGIHGDATHATNAVDTVDADAVARDPGTADPRAVHQQRQTAASTRAGQRSTPKPVGGSTRRPAAASASRDAPPTATKVHGPRRGRAAPSRRRSGSPVDDAARRHRCRPGLHGSAGRDGGLVPASPCRREPRARPRPGLVPAAGRSDRPGRRRGRRDQPPPPRPLHRPRPAPPLPAL